MAVTMLPTVRVQGVRVARAQRATRIAFRGANVRSSVACDAKKKSIGDLSKADLEVGQRRYRAC